MKIRRIDHVGVVVNDLPAAKAFFLKLGLELVGEANVGGEWVDRVVGLEGVQSSIVMLRTADGGTNVELSKFHSPPAEKNVENVPANAPGIRHIAFVVENIDAILAGLKEKGIEPFGEVQNYKNVYKLCYIRGPEGIILELAEKLN